MRCRGDRPPRNAAASLRPCRRMAAAAWQAAMTFNRHAPAPGGTMARRHPLQNALYPLLLPASALYGWSGMLRRRLFRSGALTAWDPPSFCVSVGNISWGGTGKTPVVDWLLSWCEHRNKKAAVLTRGYRAKPPSLPFAVRPDGSPAECGDEPLMLAQRHLSAQIVIDPRRARAGRALAASSLPDVFILDDGFQHLHVRRDLDLVLLDVDDVRATPGKGCPPSNWGTVLPAGTWREPASALSDAGAFLIKTTPEDWPSLIPDLESRLRTWPRPVFAFRMEPEALRPLGAAPAATPDGLGKYLLATGIGKPEQAADTVQRFFGRAPERVIAFPDHCDFRQARKALEGPGLPLVCTGKDAVKIALLQLRVPCYSLDAAADFFAALPPPGGSGDALSFPAWWERQFPS